MALKLFHTLCLANFSIKELWSHHDKNRVVTLTKDFFCWFLFPGAPLMISVLTIVVIFLDEAVGVTSLFYQQQTYYQNQIVEMDITHIITSKHHQLKNPTPKVECYVNVDRGVQGSVTCFCPLIFFSIFIISLRH